MTIASGRQGSAPGIEGAAIDYSRLQGRFGVWYSASFWKDSQIVS